MKKLTHSKLDYKKSLWMTFISFTLVITFFTAAVIYYVNVSKVEKMIVQKNKMLHNQLSNAIDALFGEIDKILIQYSMNPVVNRFCYEDIKTARDYIEISNLLAETKNLKSINPLITSVDIVYPHKKIVLSNSAYSLDELKEMKNPEASFYQYVIETNERYNVNIRDKYFGDNFMYIPVIYVYRYFEINKHIGFYIIISLNKDSFLHTVNQICSDEDVNYFILKGEDTLISNYNGTSKFLKGLNDIDGLADSKIEKVFIDNTLHYAFRSQSNYNGLQHVLLIQNKIISNQINMFNYDILNKFPVILLIALLLSLIVSKKLYKPIKNLTHYINTNVYNHKEGNEKEKYENEIGFIKDSFTSLMNEKEKAGNILKNNMPLIRRSFLLHLITGKVPDSEIMERLNTYQIDFNKKYFVFLLIKLEQKNDGSIYKKEEEEKLIQYKLEEIFISIKAENYCYSVFELENERLGVILNFSEEEKGGSKVMYSLCKHIQNEIKMLYNASLTITVGETIDDAALLRHSYMTAKSLMEQMYAVDNGEIIMYNNSMTKKSEYVYYPADEEVAIIQAIKACDKAAIEEILSMLFNLMRELQLNQKEIQFIVFQLAFVTTREMNSGEGLNKQFMEKTYGYILLGLANTTILEEYFTGLINLFHELIDFRHLKSKEKKVEIVERAKMFIDDNFMENISVEYVAEQIYVSSAHLSRIFKQETESTVLDYITHKKLSFAMKMIRESDELINNIAYKIGYNSAGSFIRAFKIFSGVTPQRYRECNGGNTQ